jgi:hypothetical protein
MLFGWIAGGPRKKQADVRLAERGEGAVVGVIGLLLVHPESGRGNEFGESASGAAVVELGDSVSFVSRQNLGR